MTQSQISTSIAFQGHKDCQSHSPITSPQSQVNINIKFLRLYQYAEKKDIIFLFFGVICAIIIGGAFPAFSLLWGSAVNAFQQRDKMIDSTLEVLFGNIKLGFCGFVVGWIMHTFFMISAASQGGKCRNLYLKSVMAQQVGWFQTQEQSILSTQLSSLAISFEGAIGQNFSNVLSNVFLLVFGVFLAFLYRWELSLVLICICPFLIYFWYLMMKVHVQSSKFQDEARDLANSKAEEIMLAIRTVKQLNSIKFQSIKYEQTFYQTTKNLEKHVRKLSNIQFAANFFFFGIFAVAFWYGSECVKGSQLCPASPRYSGGDILGILFCLLIPSLNLQQLFPSIRAIGEGKEAFLKIKKVVDRKPSISSLPDAIIPTQFLGVFKFENVFFSYPKDKSRAILKGLTVQINCKNTGIMGPSGTGKSTIFQLMMRLYDPDEGKITLDGINLKELNLNWLREKISYVGQQPLLFSSSIRENLLIGKPTASKEELFAALRKAEIAEFVEGLKEGLETYVGNGGCQLSGGQKQRLAIARALLKDPKVILLDEASSALDIKNERLIQETINRLSGEKIIISIAHRASTLQKCDQICIIDQGILSKKIRSNIQEMLESQNQQEQTQQYNPQQYQKGKTVQLQSTNNLTQQFTSQFIINQQLVSDPQYRQQSEEQSQTQQSSPFLRLLKYSAKCKNILISGVVCALIHGLILPMIGLQLGRIISMCLQYDENPQLYSQKLKTQTTIMALVTIIGAIVNKLQYYYFLTIGVRVNSLLQIDIYEKLLRLPISWFDKSQNNPSKIVSKVLKDGKIVKELFSLYVPHLSLAVSSITFGLMMALYCQWRTALVAIILMPLIGGVSALQSSFMYGNSKNTNQIYKESGQTLSESIQNIKSIQSFCCQNYILKRYQDIIQRAVKYTTKKSIFAGFIFGLSYLILYSIYGIIFYVSAIFIVHNDLEIIDALSAVFLISFTGIVAGSNLKLIPNLVNIRVSAISIFKILDSVDEEQMHSNQNSSIKAENVQGRVEFQNVSFRYPSRQEWALKSVSFTVEAGEKVALVGTSGSGKSTVLQLLLRFYEPIEGRILLDGIDIRKYELSSLRRAFGVVSQQPTLFDESVRYNIAYGNEGVSEQQLEAVSRLFSGTEQSSDVWREFLDRKVGPRGSHISGGQKQRVAIARLALRSPSVLLLDEATSALDAQNVALVEECLVKVIDGKTVINVTHNLQSLRDYSRIIVLEKGQKINEGNFAFLQSLNKQLYQFNV